MKRYRILFASLAIVAAGLSAAYAVPALPGDYNSNGVVDSADYAIQRDAVNPLANEVFGASNGTNTSADYDAWRARFGNSLVYWDIDGATAGSGGGGAAAGTWDGTNAFWTTDGIFGSSAGSAWTAGDAAAFSASNDATGTYTVTVSGTQTVSAVTFEEGTVTLSGGTVNLTSSVVQVDSGGASATINSVIGGSSGLAKTGAGTLTLGGANTYTGATTLTSVGAGTANTLKTAATNTLPSTTVLTLPAANGNAKVELFDASNVYYNQTIAGLSGGGIGTATPTVVDVGKATLTIDIPTGQSTVYAGYIKGDFTSPTDRAKVIKKGGGDLTLTGQNNNTTFGFGGEFSMEAGRLLLTNNVGTGGNDTTRPSHLTLKGGTIVKAFPDPATSMSAAVRTLEIAGSFAVDMNGSTANAQIAAATAPTGTPPNITGGIHITTANPTITVNNGLIQPNGTSALPFIPVFILAGVITDDGVVGGYGLTKAGPGILSFDKLNTYTGTTTVTEGALRVTAATTDTTKTSTIGNGTTAPVVLAGGSLEYTGGLINGGRVAKIDNPVTMTASSGIGHTTGGGAGGLTTNPVNNTSVDLLFSNFTATGGTLTIYNNGSSNEPNFGNPYANPLEFRAGFTGTGFNFAQPVVVQNHTNVLVPNRTSALMSANTSGSHTFSGVISGNGGYVRNGAGGTSVLTANNTYTGSTRIMAGTLEITNPYLADTADVLLTTGSIFKLSFGSNTIQDTIDQLFIDGTSQATGTWGDIGSGAAHENALFAGSLGMLLVSNPGAGGETLTAGNVPEPGSLLLALLAVGGSLSVTGRRRRA